ncbi:hypothetical protein TrST_g11434 [Triparma strigata]|uniref:Uncharacterized protein n=1 Tax=Triparma strigata TaxID=1606541 RepID=A0A9W7A9B5_9STRA|nr:hypothetical protein TrST_g11434 [Triparma strigata]
MDALQEPASAPTPDPNSILIFDWDDTICPSSAIDVHKAHTLADFPPTDKKFFQEISKVASKTLSLAAELGTVLIITNSDDGWVRFSAEKFLPDLLPSLDSPSIEIVSARTRYESLYPGQPLCWKAAAFAHEVNERFQNLDKENHSKDDENDTVDTSVSPLSTPRVRRNSIVMTDVPDSSSSLLSPQIDSNKRSGNPAQTVTPPGSMEKPSVMDRLDSSSSNPKEEEKKESDSPPAPPLPQPRRQVISFGDSLEERTACKIVASQLHAVPKSVKFLSHPSPVLILGQLEMLNRYMSVVVGCGEGLDLEISKEQAVEEAERRLGGKGWEKGKCKEEVRGEGERGREEREV